MKRRKLLVIPILLFSYTNGVADIDDVTQNTQLQNNFQATQSSSISNVQVINDINQSSDDISNTEQIFDLAGDDLSFTQNGAGHSNNIQAINRINVSETISNINQDVSNISNMSFIQDTTGGSNNIQAANFINASGTVSGITQNVNGQNISFQQTSGDNNIQAANLIRADSSNAGNTQTITQTTINFNIDSGSNNLQAGNAYIHTGAAGVIPQQNFNGGVLNISNTSANLTNIQIMSYFGTQP